MKHPLSVLDIVQYPALPCTLILKQYPGRLIDITAIILGMCHILVRIHYAVASVLILNNPRSIHKRLCLIKCEHHVVKCSANSLLHMAICQCALSILKCTDYLLLLQK